MLAISGSMILGNETGQTWFNEPTFYEDLLRCRKIFRRSDHDCPHGLVTASHCLPLLPTASRCRVATVLDGAPLGSTSSTRHSTDGQVVSLTLHNTWGTGINRAPRMQLSIK